MSLIEHNNSYITNSVQILLSVLLPANDDISLKFSSTDMIHKTQLTLSKKKKGLRFSADTFNDILSH